MLPGLSVWPRLTGNDLHSLKKLKSTNILNTAHFILSQYSVGIKINLLTQFKIFTPPLKITLRDSPIPLFSGVRAFALQLTNKTASRHLITPHCFDSESLPL